MSSVPPSDANGYPAAAPAASAPGSYPQPAPQYPSHTSYDIETEEGPDVDTPEGVKYEKGAAKQDLPALPSSTSSELIVEEPTVVRSYSFWGQFHALFVKNLTVQSRQYGTNICQLAFPLVIILFLFVLDIIVGNLVQDSTGKYTLEQRNPPLDTTQYFHNADPCPFLPFSATPFDSRFVAAGDPAELGTTIGSGPGLLGAMSFQSGLASTPNSVTIRPGKRDYKRAGDLAEWCSNYMLGVGVSVVTQPAPTTPAAINSFYRFIVSSWRGPLTDFVGGWMFTDLSLAQRRTEMSVLYNKTFTAGADIPAIVAPVGNALFRLYKGDTAPDSKFELEGTMNYPTPRKENEFDIISLAGPYMYLFMVQLLLPVFMSNAVSEKETKLREIVRMMGLKTPVYWVVSYIFNYILYLISIFFIIILSAALGFRMFTANDFGTYFLLFFVWGHLLVAIAWFLSAFFSSSSTATVVGYLYVFGTGILAMTLLSTTFDDPDTDRGTLIGVQFCPSFVLYRGLIALKNGVAWDQPGITMSMLSESWIPLVECYYVMLIEWIIFMALAMYCEMVVPSEYGVPRHPLFCVRKGGIFHCGKKTRSEQLSTTNGGAPALSGGAGGQATGEGDGTVDEFNRGDGRYDLEPGTTFPEDVEAARNAAFTHKRAAIRVLDIVKLYPSRDGGTFRAVDNMSLAVNRAECMGFIGPNGSGKSTTINILCGYQTATAGTALILGTDINQAMDEVHMRMGICPQDNVIWSSLTAGEHLVFYGRLKGLSGAELEADIVQKLEFVQLLEVRDKKAGEYSGGMKRRLCVAIALMGSPRVVLLDEPTTGLDIGAKHNIWNVIKKVKTRASILMVTHSMEEAAECCDKLAVVENGQISTVDTLARLEQRYVNSYKLTFSVTDFSRQAAITSFVKEQLSQRAVMTSCLGGVISFELPKEDAAISHIFERVTKTKTSLGVIDWGVTNTTLEEAILRFQEKHAKANVSVDPSFVVAANA